MLERETDWDEFLVFARNPIHTDEKVSRYTGIGATSVAAYRKQLQGPEYALRHGEVPPRLKKFLVGFRFRNLNIRYIDLPSVVRARERYEDGTHELCTGKIVVDGLECWALYSIERKRPVPPRKYFSLEQLP